MRADETLADIRELTVELDNVALRERDVSFLELVRDLMRHWEIRREQRLRGRAASRED